MRVATGNAMEHMDFGEYTWHVLNPLNMITDGLLAGLFGGATNYFRLGTAFPSQSMVNAYNASQAALQSVQAARAASQADDAANGTKNSDPSVSEGGTVAKGTLIGKLDGLTADERGMVEDLRSSGKNVEIIPRSDTGKTPDFFVDGVKTELKTLNGSSLNTPVTRIEDGFEQGAEIVIINGRKTGLTLEQAETVIVRALGKYDGELPGIVEIWTKEGIVRR